MKATDTILNEKRHFLLLTLFFISIIPLVIIYYPLFQNDTYWLLNTGKYIIQNGFPYNEPFTIHEGLNFTAQQWLTTIILYLCYSQFGIAALFILKVILFGCICFMLYKVSFLISKNESMSLVVAGFGSVLLIPNIVLRPQIFSMIIFLAEIYFLELFMENKKKINLIPLALLSLLLINMHGALWIFYFLIFVPYIIDAMEFNFSISKLKEPKLIGLILTVFFAFLLGFINPYVVQNVAYLLHSFGNQFVNQFVSEMSSPDFKSSYGISVFIYVAAVALIYINHKGTTRLRYVLITFGTLYMGLSSIRSFSLFIICALPFIAYYLRDVRYEVTLKTNRLVVFFAFAMLCIACLGLIKNQFKISVYPDEPYMQQCVDYLVQNVDVGKMRLYNEYETGGFLEYKGIKTLIDSRAEIFLKSINRKEDIFMDYANLSNGKMHYIDFIDKYKLSHFMITRDTLMDVYLKKDAGYKLLYSNDKFEIFAKANIK